MESLLVFFPRLRQAVLMWKEFLMIARSLTMKIILFVAFFCSVLFLLSFRALCPAVCREVSGRDEA